MFTPHKPVTLAGAGLSREAADRIGAARQHLKAFRATPVDGDRNAEEPTLERLIHAGESVETESFESVVDLPEGVRTKPVFVKAKRMRIEDSPLARLERGGHLGDPHVKGLNAIRAAAGAMYRLHWYEAGMAGAIPAMDPSKPFVGNLTPAGLTRVEGKEGHYSKFVAAANCLPHEFRRVVDAVVLQERGLLDIGAEVCYSKSEKIITAIVLHTLRHGLQRLARHFRIV
jgi:hypothetical protein